MDSMNLFKLDVVEYLGKIEAKCKRWNVPMNKLTLIMRDPDRADMFVVLTNETPEGVKVAAGLAVGEGGVIQRERRGREEDSRR